MAEALGQQSLKPLEISHGRVSRQISCEAQSEFQQVKDQVGALAWVDFSAPQLRLCPLGNKDKAEALYKDIFDLQLQ